MSVNFTAADRVGSIGGYVGGIAALMGGLGGGCGDGLLGGLFGGNKTCNTVSQQELAYAIALASSEGKNVALALAREEDDKIRIVQKESLDGLIQVGNALAVVNQKAACLEILTERNREEAKNYTDMKVDFEAQLRKAGDDNVAAWTQAELNKKIDGTLRIDGKQICYDSCKPILQHCPCGSEAAPYNVVTATKGD